MGSICSSLCKPRPEPKESQIQSEEGVSQCMVVISDNDWKKLEPEILSFKEKLLITEVWKAIGCAPFSEFRDFESSTDSGISSHECFFREVWLKAALRSSKICKNLGLDSAELRSDDGRHFILQQYPKFRKLTREVTSFFEILIELEGLDITTIIERSICLGVRHREMEFLKGFQPVVFNIFAVSLVELMEEIDLPEIQTSKKNDALYVWHKFVHLVINQMMEGYRNVIQ